jgi:hypothetical protein
MTQATQDSSKTIYPKDKALSLSAAQEQKLSSKEPFNEDIFRGNL